MPPVNHEWVTTQVFKAGIQLPQNAGGTVGITRQGGGENDGIVFDGANINFIQNGDIMMRIGIADVWINVSNISMDFFFFNGAGLGLVKFGGASNEVRFGEPANILGSGVNEFVRCLSYDNRTPLYVAGHTTQTNPLFRCMQNDGASGIDVLQLSNDGVFRMRQQGASPAGNPAAGYWFLYFLAGGLTIKNSAGTVTTLT